MWQGVARDLKPSLIWDRRHLSRLSALVGLWPPAVLASGKSGVPSYQFPRDLALVEFEQWLPLHVCVWAPDRQTITLTFPVWQIVFSKMTTADSSSTYGSRILPSAIRRWRLFLPRLTLFQGLEYGGRDVMWLPALVLKGQYTSTCLFLLGCWLWNTAAML